MPSFRVCLSVLLTALLPLQHVGISVVPHSAMTTITAADITYDGAIGTGGAPNDQYTYGSVTGRKVSGTNHFYLYQRSKVSTPLSTIASGTSTTVFTVSSGNGSRFTVGSKVHVLRAANRPGALSDNTVIAAIASDTITVSPALGGTPAANDFAYEDPADWIVEYVDPGTWNTDYTHATNASYTNYYQDPYQGHRMGWNATGNTWSPYITFQIPVPAGLYYNQSNGLMYYSYFDYYESSSIHNFNLGAVDLATGTNYGPWRTSYRNGDGVVGLGAKQCQFFESDPLDSTKMICGAGIDINGSIGATPWGPNYIERAWPTTSTPAGLANPDLTFSTDGLNFYNMIKGAGGNPTANYFNSDGSIHGVLRSMQYPNTTFGFVWEHRWQSQPVNTANRAHNGGYNTWSEQDSTEGLLDFRGAYKSGVIFVASLVGKNGGDNTDCTLGAHEWYSNAGVGRLNCEHGCTTSCGITGLPQLRGTGRLPADFQHGRH